MKEKRAVRNRCDRSGQALIIAIILLVIAVVLVLANVYFMQQTARQQVAQAKIIKERYAAEAGLQMTLEKLNTDATFSEQIQDLGTGQRNPFDTTAGPRTIQWEGESVTVVIEAYK